MTEPFELIDALGPEKVIHIHDPATGLKAILVIDNVAAGPAIGGCRMAVDVSLEECARLARAMTLKNAAACLPHGGAKSVIFGDPKMPVADKERLIRSFAYAIRNNPDYIIGPDMGTDEICMAWCHDVIGRAVGLPRELGGIPLDLIGATGYGLCAAIEVAAEFCDLDLHGATVVVQGFGSVGIHVARFLAAKGAVLIGVADIHGGLADPRGLDVAALMALKGRGGKVQELGSGELIDREAIIDIGCDIWIPAARPDVIRMDNVDRLQTKIFAEGANIPASPAAEDALASRGTIILPDFIANAGGVICGASEYGGRSELQAMSSIAEQVAGNTRSMLERAQREGISSRQAAMDMAGERVRQAMRYRKTC